MTQYLYDHQPLHLSAVTGQAREYDIPDTEGITCHGLARVVKVEDYEDKLITRNQHRAKLCSRKLPLWVINWEIEDPSAGDDQLWFWISHFRVDDNLPSRWTIYEKYFVYHPDTQRYTHIKLNKGIIPSQPDLEVMDKAGFSNYDFLGICDLEHIEACIQRYVRRVQQHTT